MNQVFVSSNEEDQIDTQVFDLLRTHFGHESVHVVGEGAVNCQRGDVLLVLLKRRKTDTDGSQVPVVDKGSLLARWIERALDLNVAVIPVLVDGALLPAAKNLPEELRGLAYKQWQILEIGEHWARDLGKIIGQIEIHLPTRPGTLAAIDYWLFPLGILLVVWGALVTLQWLMEVLVWHYGFQTSVDVTRLRWKFCIFGFLPLGVGTVLIAAGLFWQKLRFDVSRRAEDFRHGRFQESYPHEPVAYVTLGFGVLSIATGLSSLIAGGFTVLIASFCALFGLMRWRRDGRLEERQKYILGVGIAWLAILLSVVVHWRSEAIANCLVHMTKGTALATPADRDSFLASDDDNFAAANKEFEAAKKTFPASPLSYHALATVSYRQLHEDLAPKAPAPAGVTVTPEPVLTDADVRRRLESILHELDGAIRRYPQSARGFFEPSRAEAQKAYELRATVEEELGRKDEAEQDRTTARKIRPSFDILGGFFRWWEASGF
jgi:hypothetical protein